MAFTVATAERDELASLDAMSVELAALHEPPQVPDTALGYCLRLTSSDRSTARR